MRLHAALPYIRSHPTFMAAVIFSPFLLTNKIVIIEGITLSCEAVFKWRFFSFVVVVFLLLLFFFFFFLLREQVCRMPSGLLGACAYTYFSIFTYDWVDLPAHMKTHFEHQKKNTQFCSLGKRPLVLPLVVEVYYHDVIAFSWMCWWFSSYSLGSCTICDKKKYIYIYRHNLPAARALKTKERKKCWTSSSSWN